MARRGKPARVEVIGDASSVQKEFDKVAKEAGKLSDTFDSVGGSITDSLSPAALATGVLAGATAVAGLFVKGFLDGVEAEALTDKLAARLDLSEGEAEAAGALASGLYRDAWGESLEDVNAAISDVVTILDADVTGASADMTKSMVEDALTIADVWDKDVNEVVRAAGALMDNDLAQSADEAFDIITTGLSEGADLNGDFLDTLFEYSTFFDDAGFSAERMLSGLIQGTDAGMMGVDKVGDAVKEMGLIIQGEGEASQQALEDLGFDADTVAAAFAKGGDYAGEATQDIITALADVEDPLAQTQLAIALMGVPFEDLGSAGPEVLEALASGTLELRDTAAVAETAYDNTATSIEEFKRRGTGALQDFVGAFLGAFGFGGGSGKDLKGGGSLKSALDALNDWIEDNEDNIRTWGENAAGFVKDVWEETEELRESFGKVIDWFNESENIDKIAEWAGRAEFWAGVVKAAWDEVTRPLQAIIDAVEWVNDQLGSGGGKGSKDGLGKGSSSGGGGGGGGNPYFHDGGIFTTTNGSNEGMAILRHGEGVFTEGQMAALGGMIGTGGDTIHIHVGNLVATKEDLVRDIEAILVRRSLRSGQGVRVSR